LPQVSAVNIDEEEGVFQAAEHLLKVGGSDRGHSGGRG
jgi:DNA-binding LacI/PurR family transcriptional regulator